MCSDNFVSLHVVLQMCVSGVYMCIRLIKNNNCRQNRALLNCTWRKQSLEQRAGDLPPLDVHPVARNPGRCGVVCVCVWGWGWGWRAVGGGGMCECAHVRAGGRAFE